MNVIDRKEGANLKKKNLLLIHLESLNMYYYKLHQHLFPNINKIMARATSFEKFYSTATSTIMAVTDLVYGTIYKDEKNASISDKYQKTKYTSLFDILNSDGYAVSGLMCPEDDDSKKMQNMRMFGKDICVQSYTDYDVFMEEIVQVLNGEEPFAAYLLNYVSHVSFKKKGQYYNNSFDAWLDSYRELDRWVGILWDTLERNKKLENTLIVMYGDHGDDFWGHRLHNGLTHAIEPYAQMIHTPLAIYAPGSNLEKECLDLIVMTDLKRIILQLLYKNTYEKKDRQFAFARNMYANQKLKVYSFGKGYAVTDGIYLLLVSIRGLELYNIIMDPFNTCNLLEFFMIDEESHITFDKRFQKVKFSHYREFFTYKEIAHIKRRFGDLYKELYLQTQKIYASANLNEKRLNRELRFDKIHNIHNYKLYDRNIIDVLEK